MIYVVLFKNFIIKCLKSFLTEYSGKYLCRHQCTIRGQRGGSEGSEGNGVKTAFFKDEDNAIPSSFPCSSSDYSPVLLNSGSPFMILTFC